MLDISVFDLLFYVNLDFTNIILFAILASMDETILRKAGLTESQVKVYSALLRSQFMTPVQLAKETGESRNNAYAIADKLVSYGLVQKIDEPKITYKVLHPSALETLAEKRRKQLVRDEQIVKQNISPLIDMFYALREEPGARTLQGPDGIQEVFKDILRTNQDIYYLRAPAVFPTVPTDFFDEYKKERLKRGIHTYTLSPMSESAKKGVTEGLDKQTNVHRTFIPDEVYTQPVEIEAYGDKIAFIAYGETQMATVITSPPIAAALKEVFKMLQAAYKDYSDRVKAELH